MVEDYVYVGVDFHGDLDLALPNESQWGDTGKKDIFCLYNFFVALMISFFFCY
jgi:hypothetical protein